MEMFETQGLVLVALIVMCGLAAISVIAVEPALKEVENHSSLVEYFDCDERGDSCADKRVIHYREETDG